MISIYFVGEVMKVLNKYFVDKGLLLIENKINMF